MTAAPVEQIARAAAARLAAVHGSRLPVEVEAALHTRDEEGAPSRYIDPVAIGSLIVSIATLAWTVYNDLRKKTPDPSAQVLARTIRVELRDYGRLSPTERDQLIDVVVTETLDSR